MPQRLPPLPSLLLICALALSTAGCKTSADRAAEMLVSGQAQEQAGQYERAARTYREALDLDPESIDLRRALARLQLRQENYLAARVQFTALRERIETDVEANLALAEIALTDRDADRAESFLQQARAVEPDAPGVRAAQAAVAFYRAEALGDDAGRQAALDAARGLVDAAPEAMAARRILIQAALDGPDPGLALPLVEAGLALRPHSLELNRMKLAALRGGGDDAAVGAQLRLMYSDFPDDPDVQAGLADWYLAGGTVPETLAFLLDLSARRGEPAADHDRIARYVRDRLPPAEARAELERIAAGMAPGAIADSYRVQVARLRFDMGEHEAAIAALRELVADRMPLATAPGPRTELAAMLDADGQRQRARTLIRSVLARDPTHAPALAMRARWLIADKEYNSAISALRVALTSDKNDPALLILMAEAYAGTGATALASESFADAVAASGKGAAESARFARFLLDGGNGGLARTVLEQALALHPDDAPLQALAQEAGLTGAAPSP